MDILKHKETVLVPIAHGHLVSVVLVPAGRGQIGRAHV